jgi:histidine triad (HIT) family protein
MEADMGTCVFCDISAGELPGHFVYEDEQIFGILSLEQPTPYKVLVIPRAHVETLFDLSDAQAAAIFKATVKIARAVRAASDCKGLNLVQSNGKVGQQDVFHFHLHIVARFDDDAIILDWDNTPVSSETLGQYAFEIRSNLQNS